MNLLWGRKPEAPNADHPLHRPGGLCAVRNCTKPARRIRVTANGWYVAYCHTHELQASYLFDNVEMAA